MKLLLITVVSYIAHGACLAGSASNGNTKSLAANVVCTAACAAATTKTAADASSGAGVKECKVGYSGAPIAAACTTDGSTAAAGGLNWSGCTACTGQTGCKTNTPNKCSTGSGVTTKLVCAAASDGFFLKGSGDAAIATACTKATNVATLTCTDATAANTVVLSCDAGYKFTAIVPTSLAVVAKAYVKALPLACPAVVGVTLVVAKDAVSTAVKSSCATAKCAGTQTGCVATKTTPNSCSTGDMLKCTETSDGYMQAGGAVVKCMGANVKTWKAAASPWTSCTATACDAGFKLAGGNCLTANACLATAAPTGYVAAGIPAIAAVTAVTRACPNSCAATPPTGTCTAGVAAVTLVAAKLAKDATSVALTGAVTCATGYTGTGVATCPVAAAKLVYTGCTMGTAPASVAQTIVAFMLTVVAMYL